VAIGGRTDEEEEHQECRLEVEESSLKLLGVSASEVNDGQSFDLRTFFFTYHLCVRSTRVLCCCNNEFATTVSFS